MVYINNLIHIPKKSLRVNSLKLLETPLNGAEIGIPLNIFSNVFTNLHYGYDITNYKSFILQFLLGYYTYGSDRFKDALNYQMNPYETRKKDLYNKILENRNWYEDTLNVSFCLVIILLLCQKDFVYNIPFIPLLYSTQYYDEIKKKITIFKPAYIAIMWTLATVIIPCVLHDHDYSIINYPLDYLPCTLNLFAASNFADNKDIDDDKINKIETIPVKYGKVTSNIIGLIALLTSSILLIENTNYMNRPIINSFFELQNFVTIGLLYNDTFY